MSTLPSGTITLLFTDIEGSTRLLQRLGSSYADALEDHRRLLRAAWAAHEGVEVGTEGDSFFVVFPRATDAVLAAAEATRSLASHPWPNGASLAVRIGVHSGAPALSGNQYVGLDVHRAARISAAGHGGQTLLSQTTRDLCVDELPGELSLIDLGDAHLKDLQRPERLYQLVVAGLPYSFPPLKTLDRVPNNLPRQPTPFLGRQEVVKRVSAELEQAEARVLTLMGPGGIGKTRIALEVAAHMIDTFPDGVYFTDLSPLTDPSLVAGAIARSLGLREAGGMPAEENLHATLGSQRMLLTIDNFEQVVDAADVLGRLTAACPGVKTLVTSRVALRLRGEHEFVIPPLEIPEPVVASAGSSGRINRAIDIERIARNTAVELFVERAREVKRDFTLTAANAPAVAEICRRLDGLPLAIELAAARLKILSPQAILSRLSKRLDILAGGPRDQPQRQQTMRAAIAWSYDLLRPSEQTIFRRMAVFSGGWTLEAAEAVCGADLDVFEGLEALLDQSLLVQREQDDGESRFWQLETIRAFAQEQFEASGEAEAVASAHAGYFLSLAERTQHEARGLDAQLWLGRLEYEIDNFRAALVWARNQREMTLGLRLASALTAFWHSRGHEREGARVLEELLALAEPFANDSSESSADFREIYAWGLGRAGGLHVYLADFERANVLLQRALDAERALGNSERALRTLNMLGVSTQLQGDLETAERWLDEGLTIARATGQEALATLFLSNLGDLAYHRGDLERASSCFAERLTYCERTGDPAGVAVGQQNMGRTLLRQGHIERAAVELRRSLAGARRLGDSRRIAEGLEGCAALAGAQGEAERAARLLGAASQLRDNLGTPQPPLEKADIEAQVEAARASLGADAWKAAFDDGCEQPLDQVIESESGSADDA